MHDESPYRRRASWPKRFLLLLLLVGAAVGLSRLAKELDGRRGQLIVVVALVAFCAALGLLNWIINGLTNRKLRQLAELLNQMDPSDRQATWDELDAKDREYIRQLDDKRSKKTSRSA